MPAYVSPDNIQVTPLQSQTFTSGASVSIQTAGALPTGRRVRQVIFRLDLDITQPGAGAAVQNGAILHQLISQCKVGRRVSITGFGMLFLDWLMNGFPSNLPPGLPATANGVFSRSIVWTLNYCDLSSRTPDDSAVPSELWTDPIEIRFGTNAIFAATVPTLGNGLLRTFVVHDAASSAKNGKRVTIPQSLNIQSDDFNALTALINKPGAWAYAVLYRETGITAGTDNGQVTSTQVSNVIASVDGVPLMNNVRAQDIVTVFNRVKAEGGVYRNETNNGVAGTLPIPGTATNTFPPSVSGELIMEQPGPANGAGQGVTMDCIPLLFPPKNYHVSMLPRAKTGFRADLTGTLTGYKVAYRLIERRPDSAVANASRRLGITKGTFIPKPDAAKSNLTDDPELAPFLPATVVEG